MTKFRLMSSTDGWADVADLAMKALAEFGMLRSSVKFLVPETVAEKFNQKSHRAFQNQGQVWREPLILRHEIHRMNDIYPEIAVLKIEFQAQKIFYHAASKEIYVLEIDRQDMVNRQD